MTDSIKPVVKPQAYKDLLHRARQVRKVRTNPASYRPPELDMPITKDFTD